MIWARNCKMAANICSSWRGVLVCVRVKGAGSACSVKIGRFRRESRVLCCYITVLSWVVSVVHKSARARYVHFVHGFLCRADTRDWHRLGLCVCRYISAGRCVGTGRLWRVRGCARRPDTGNNPHEVDWAVYKNGNTPAFFLTRRHDATGQRLLPHFSRQINPLTVELRRWNKPGSCFVLSSSCFVWESKINSCFWKWWFFLSWWIKQVFLFVTLLNKFLSQTTISCSWQYENLLISFFLHFLSLYEKNVFLGWMYLPVLNKKKSFWKFDNLCFFATFI